MTTLLIALVMIVAILTPFAVSYRRFWHGTRR
jgi:hypothetical protein